MYDALLFYISCGYLRAYNDLIYNNSMCTMPACIPIRNYSRVKRGIYNAFWTSEEQNFVWINNNQRSI